MSGKAYYNVNWIFIMSNYLELRIETEKFIKKTTTKKKSVKQPKPSMGLQHRLLEVGFMWPLNNNV